MKKISLLIATIALFAGIESSAQNIISADQISVSINSSTTRQELYQIRTDMEAQGVLFNYQPEFNQDRVLVAIKYELRDSSKVLGKYESGPLANPNANAGFRLTKQDGVYAPACIGNCN